MLTYESFTGVNNVLPEQRMGKDDLLRAGNVDIGLTGELSRSEGFTSASELCHKNLHEAVGIKLVTVDGVLTVLHPDGSRIALDARLGTQRVWYCNLPDGRVTYSNGLVQGIVDGRSWAGIAAHNAALEHYKVLLDAYRTYAMAYETVIKAEMNKVEVYKAMLQRVLDEKQELDIRITRLDEFILRNALFRQLDRTEQSRMRRQLDVMRELSVILGEHIASF